MSLSADFVSTLVISAVMMALMLVSQRSGRIIILSILLSFLLHTLLYMSFERIPSRDKNIAEKETIEFEVINSQKRRKKITKNFIKDFDLNKQLETTKQKALYLSRKTRRIKKQTVASQSGITKNRAQRIKKQSSQRKKKSNKKKISKAKKSLDGLFPSYIGQDFNPSKNRNYLAGMNLTDHRTSTISTHIPNVDKASITAIDTDQGLMKYYAFYMRLHDQIYPRWSNNIEHVISIVKSKEYNFLTLRPRITTLEVILNSKGEYLGHIVVKSSSSKMIDFAATDAFRRASPFLNPPKDLIEDDGRIYLPFNFRLELSGRRYARGN